MKMRYLINSLSFIITIALLIVYGLFVPAYNEKQYMDDLRETHTEIVNLYSEVFSVEHNHEEKDRILGEIFTQSHEVNPYLVLIGIFNFSSKPIIHSRNGILLKNKAFYDEILSDIESKSLNKEDDYFYKHYKDDDQRKKFYFFINDLGNENTKEQLVLVFSDINQKRFYIKMLFEMLLITFGMIILSILFHAIIPKKKKEVFISDRNIPIEKYVPSIKPLTENTKCECKLPIVEDNFYNSKILNILSSELSGYDFETCELYIRTGPKTFIKHCEFSKAKFEIPEFSSSAVKILNAETIEALRTFNFMLTDAGTIFSIPLISNSVVGMLSIKGKNVLTGDEIAYLKQVTQKVSTLITNILTEEKLIIHENENLVSKLQFHLKYKELVWNYKQERKDFSTILICFCKEKQYITANKLEALCEDLKSLIKDSMPAEYFMTLNKNLLSIVLPNTNAEQCSFIYDAILDIISSSEIRISTEEIIVLDPKIVCSSSTDVAEPWDTLNYAFQEIVVKNEAEQINNTEQNFEQPVVQAVQLKRPEQLKQFEHPKEPEPYKQTEQIKQTEQPKFEYSTNLSEENLDVKNKNGVKISIGFKLITIISFIIISSLSTITFLATNSFTTHNKIRENQMSLQTSGILAEKIRTDFESIIARAMSISQNFIDITLLDDANALAQLGRDKDILFISTAKMIDDQLSLDKPLQNGNLCIELGISSDDIENAIKAHANSFMRSFDLIPVIENISSSPRLASPVIALSQPFMEKGMKSETILIILINATIFNNTVQAGGRQITKSFIVTSTGTLIGHYDPINLSDNPNFQHHRMVEEMAKSGSPNSQHEYPEEGIMYLGSFQRIDTPDIAVITTAQRDEVLAAVDKLQRENILITLIVLNIAILIVYFFSKTLINPIKRLVNATKEIERGNYSIRIRAKSKDEIGLLADSFSNMGQGLAEREQIKNTFGKFVDPEIAKQMLSGDIKLGGEIKDVTIFFSDIRSFTAISEKLNPDEVVEFLNEYMTRMVDCINKTNGTVNKFIGDAIMAIWGAPISHGHSNDAENAVNAALMMREALKDYNRLRGGDRKPIISIGCGIGTGPVLAGQIGSMDRMEYTVIGDTVNLTSRIESLSKPFGADILISSESYELVKDIFNVLPMEKIKVKGKTEPLQVYAVLGRFDNPHTFKTMDELREYIGIKNFDEKAIDPNKEEVKYEAISSGSKI